MATNEARDPYVTDDPDSPPPPGMYWERCDHSDRCLCDGLGYYAEDISSLDDPDEWTEEG